MKVFWNAEEDEESFVLENEWDIAIPVSLEEIGGNFTVSFFPSAEIEIRSWFERFSGDPFSDDSFRYLWHMLAPKVKEWGYVPEPHRGRWGYILNLTPADLNTTKIRSDTRRLTEEDEKRNRTTYDLETTVQSGFVAYGTVADGKIVSVAVTHAEPFPGKTTEIGVETQKAHRGCGMASSNLAALSQVLLAKESIPEYRCFSDNTASLRTAESVGFQKVGRYYYYVLRRKKK